MSNITANSINWRSRLWALPLLLGSGFNLARGLDTESTPHLVLSVGMLLGGLFALRHNLSDTTPSGLDPKRIGALWLAMLLASVLLVLAAAVMAFLA